MKTLLTIFGITAADQAVKRQIEKEWEPHHAEEFLGGKIRISNIPNSGIVMGKFRNHPKMVKAVTGAFISVLALRLAGLHRVRGSAPAKAGLAMVIGGALSNWLDRARQGYVTDYINLKVKNRRFRDVYFNIGDFAIMIGAVLSLFGSSEQ